MTQLSNSSIWSRFRVTYPYIRDKDVYPCSWRQGLSTVNIIFLSLDLVLFIFFLGTFGWLIRALPAEGLKLRGTVDTGVDLLGSRTELWWVAVFGILLFVGNTGLALIVCRFERIASLYLLVATAPLLLLLSAALFVVFALNTATI